MTNENWPRPSRSRITLDSQLMTYWEREAHRLDALAARSSWAWMARRYARKADRARAQAMRSRDREIARAPKGDTTDEA